MNTDYVNFDTDKERLSKDKENNSAVQEDEFHYDEHTPYLDIIIELLYLSSPLIFMYATHMIWSTLIYYNISDRPIYITEGKSIIFVYYYTIMVGMIWGFAIGFEIKGSRAYGAMDFNEIYNLLSSNITFYTYFCAILMLLSVTLVPYLFSFLPFHPLAIDNFKSEMLFLIFTYPMVVVICLLGRLSNMLQRNHILNYATLYSLIVQIIGSWFFMSYLEMDSYGMGCTFLCTYFTKAVVIVRDFYIEVPQGIDVFKTKFMNICSSYVLENFYFSIFPALNVLVVLLSAEINSYIGLLVDDLTFTTLCIYFNVYSIIALVFEAIGNSMTILVSYSIGKNNHALAWKIWKASIRIVIPSLIVICIIIKLFSKNIFSLFSTDENFQKLANDHSTYLVVSLFFAGFHYVLSEFIITCGHMKFPFIVSLVLRFGFHMIVTTILVLFLKGGMGIILTNWIIAQVISIIIFSWKIYSINKNGIHIQKAD